MAATQLGLYSGALRLLGERKLSSLTEARHPRYLLDDAWGTLATDGAAKHCLQLGQWTFAMRTVMIDYSPSITPSFGYNYAFDQPTDLVKVSAICADEYFNNPILEYADERAYWYCDLQTIYVRYVSNNASYGGDLSLWPKSFQKVVEAYLAVEICTSLTQSETKLQKVEKALEQALLSAKSLDAMNKPTMFMPQGSWTSARRGGRHLTRYSGGYR